MLWDARYLLGEALGGGFIEAYRARDTHTEQSCIVKILREDMLSSNTGFDEWLSDTRTRALHRSPCLPGVYFAKHTPRPYSVNEDISGPSFARLGDQSDADWARLIRALQAMVRGLQAAGIVPDDLDPTNIVFRDGDLEQPVYIDCGRVKEHGDAWRTLRAAVFARLTGYDGEGPWRERWAAHGQRLPPPLSVKDFRPDLPLASAALDAPSEAASAVERRALPPTAALVAAALARGTTVWRLSPAARVCAGGFSHVSKLELPLRGVDKLERSLEAFALSGMPLLVVAHDAAEADAATRALIEAIRPQPHLTLLTPASSADDLPI